MSNYQLQPLQQGNATDKRTALAALNYGSPQAQTSTANKRIRVTSAQPSSQNVEHYMGGMHSDTSNHILQCIVTQHRKLFPSVMFNEELADLKMLMSTMSATLNRLLDKVSSNDYKLKKMMEPVTQPAIRSQISEWQHDAKEVAQYEKFKLLSTQSMQTESYMLLRTLVAKQESISGKPSEESIGNRVKIKRYFPADPVTFAAKLFSNTDTESVNEARLLHASEITTHLNRNPDNTSYATLLEKDIDFPTIDRASRAAAEMKSLYPDRDSNTSSCVTGVPRGNDVAVTLSFPPNTPEGTMLEMLT
ncbi:hypothetical protein BC829DRAFT_442619 [Chytridium lagenaria]|nr:hypothetical protein BC829DRAFT_442619 [Chytridium lagenaria]